MPEVNVSDTFIMTDQNPNKCPACRRKAAPEYVGGEFLSSDDKKVALVTYRCNREDCDRLFVARYVFLQGFVGSQSRYRLHITTPTAPEVPDQVTKISPDFARIYGQAYSAEAYKLDAVVGVAFRKALEFLIKDYCILRHADKTDEIKRTSLGICIKRFIDDPTIRDCAARAAWIGNDETHYVRKWVATDINDLKNLIEVTMRSIQASLLAARYRVEMPDP